MHFFLQICKKPCNALILKKIALTETLADEKISVRKCKKMQGSGDKNKNKSK
jgi:hypothetical protein